jgi:hypothetical protein
MGNRGQEAYRVIISVRPQGANPPGSPNTASFLLYVFASLDRLGSPVCLVENEISEGGSGFQEKSGLTQPGPLFIHLRLHP